MSRHLRPMQSMLSRFRQEHNLAALGIDERDEFRTLVITKKRDIRPEWWPSICLLMDIEANRVGSKLTTKAAQREICDWVRKIDGREVGKPVHDRIGSAIVLSVHAASNRVLGMAVLRYMFGTFRTSLTLSHLVVLPLARGYGIGSSLITHSEEYVLRSKAFRRWLEKTPEASNVLVSSVESPIEGHGISFLISLGFTLLPLLLPGQRIPKMLGVREVIFDVDKDCVVQVDG